MQPTAQKVSTKVSKATKAVSSAEQKVQAKVEFDFIPQPHTPQQDLEHFGTWIGKPIWVPPKDCSDELAKSMLNQFSPFATKAECWDSTIRKHRSKFTQVRQIELRKESIRLPQGRLYVMVTERENFDKIDDPVPECVNTRLEEFLAGPGQKRGVKVFYLKPLCVEVGSDLIFTKREEIDQAISQIQEEVYREYRRRYPLHAAKSLAVKAADAVLAIPRSVIHGFLNRRKREVDQMHAKLEFERRRRAMKAVRHYKKYRKDECKFDDVLALTDAPDRNDVIEHIVRERVLKNMDRQFYLTATAANLPWFAALSFAAYKVAMVAVTTTVTVAVCDPAFVAQMPGSNGALLKIGHFDEVDGVMHVEI